ncbi:hypothetical protein CBR_g46245 [Chara braunii]|uniref:DUF659 domain-containing protein n=1 Tax=Chara braunii TaxID=69332 RepID=A0A388K3R6_CHABU|nr:hypothetical protein CBR_g46245 [Chara braunii]|eukprot:GBG64702.1 hypothetical protein CBR_g46245 [Chara braunii]
MKCLLCGLVFPGNRARGLEHFTKKRPALRCPNATIAIYRRLRAANVELPLDVEEMLQREDEAAAQTVPNLPLPAICAADDVGGGPGVEQREEGPTMTGATMTEVTRRSAPARRQRQMPIDRYVRNPRQREIDLAAMDLFAQNAIPFNVAKSSSWKKFCELCFGPQSAARCPLKHVPYNALREELLDSRKQTYLEREAKLRVDWEKTGCTLITDGTTDICGRSLLNYILARRDRPVFIKCDHVKRKDKNSAAMLESWKTFLRENRQATAICTDSFASNKAAAEALGKDPKFAYIYWIPCTAHCMDLFLHDLGGMTWAKKILDEANEVVKFFRIHSAPREMLFGHGKTVLKRPQTTRFGTNFIMLERLKEKEARVKDTVNNMEWEEMQWPYAIRDKALLVERLVQSTYFWNDVRMMFILMEGAFSILRMVDRDVHCISRVYDAAVALKNCVLAAPLTEGQRVEVLKVVSNRTDQLLGPVHTVARLLDPNLRDRGVFSDPTLMTQFRGVVEHLVGARGTPQYQECIDSLYAFQREQGIFGDPEVQRRGRLDSALDWWEDHGRGHPALQRLALRILSMWTASSPAERNWSTWALVHTKDRNKLEHERVEKLVYLHWNLRYEGRVQGKATNNSGWLGNLNAETDADDEEDETAAADECTRGTTSAIGSTSVARPTCGGGGTAMAQRKCAIGGTMTRFPATATATATSRSGSTNNSTSTSNNKSSSVSNSDNSSTNSNSDNGKKRNCTGSSNNSDNSNSNSSSSNKRNCTSSNNNIDSSNSNIIRSATSKNNSSSNNGNKCNSISSSNNNGSSTSGINSSNIINSSSSSSSSNIRNSGSTTINNRGSSSNNSKNSSGSSKNNNKSRSSNNTNSDAAPATTSKATRAAATTTTARSTAAPVGGAATLAARGA